MDWNQKTAAFMRQIGIPEDVIHPENPDDLFQQIWEAVQNRDHGPWKDLPEEIWLDTMKCFPRFIGEHRVSYGRNGFDRGFWTVRQIDARLFRIGELEYEMETDESSFGRRISLHIPSDAKLEPERLNASVQSAKAFFRRWFPEWENLPMCCESWLLSPKLRDWLPAGSRILRFQDAFDLEETFPEDDAALEWVFHVAAGQREGLRLADLPEETSLQRQMKADLLQGGKPGAAAGRLTRLFGERR